MKHFAFWSIKILNFNLFMGLISPHLGWIPLFKIMIGLHEGRKISRNQPLYFNAWECKKGNHALLIKPRKTSRVYTFGFRLEICGFSFWKHKNKYALLCYIGPFVLILGRLPTSVNKILDQQNALRSTDD